MSSLLLREREPVRQYDSSQLIFEMLGPFQAKRGSVTLELGPPKQRALLASLLLHPNHVTSTEQLIDALWGERYPAYAKNLVQKYVSGIRSAIATDGDAREDISLTWTGDGYLLQPGEAIVDLYDYERLSSAGVTAALAGELHRAAQLLDEARALRYGTIAEGLDAPLLERERLYRDERFLADLELRAEIEVDLGRHRNAVPHLRCLVHKYPLRERFVWLLMLALYRADRGGEALGVYAEFRSRVSEELGTDPGPALRSLHERILRQDPQLMLSSVLMQNGGPEQLRPAVCNRIPSQDSPPEEGRRGQAGSQAERSPAV